MALRLFTRPFAPRPLSDGARAVLGRAEPLTLVHDGLRLRGYRWSTSDARENPPTVVLAHGWGSRAARFTRWVEPLREAGFSVVAFDGPAHGRSEGRRLSMPDYVRVLTAVVRSVENPYAIVGHSFGGAAATFAAAGHHLSGLPRAEVDRLVIIAAPDTAVEVFGQFGDLVGLGRGQLEAMKSEAARQAGIDVPLERWSAADMLTAHPLPTLVVHDRGDDEVPFTNGEAIARAPRTSLQAVEGYGHHRVVGDAGVIAKAVGFLSEGVESGRRIA